MSILKGTAPLNPIRHGGHDGTPKCFLPLCSNAKEKDAETW